MEGARHPKYRRYRARLAITRVGGQIAGPKNIHTRLREKKIARGTRGRLGLSMFLYHNKIFVGSEL